MLTNKIKKYLCAFAVASLGIVSLASCTKPEYKVEFMVQNSNGVWNVLKEETTVEQKVTLPEAPDKLYYNFSGWYDSEELTTKFVESEIEQDSKAYAKYVPEEVTIHFNGGEALTKDLIDIVNGSYTQDPGENLSFDGWYKDAAYAVKWNGKDVVKDLYAQSVAVINYNNGYEDVYTTFVKPGTVIKSPAETAIVVDEVETTLEKTEIVENYMDPKNIKYVDDSGKPFDFSKAIEKNTNVTVRWNSINLGSIRKHTKTEGYYLEWATSCDELKKAPAVSITNEFTITESVQGEDGTSTDVDKVINIDTIRMYGDQLPSTAEYLYIGEGINLVKGLNGIGASKMKEVSLPKSLKVIDNSFSNMPLVSNFDIPNGVEVIVGSFFGSTLATAANRYETIYMGEEYNFEINVPSSVKNLAMVPTNLKFASGSKFYKEDDRIYTNVEKGKVLISDNKHINDQTIVVPEGVQGIQTGTYNIDFDFIKLPSTFEFVNYNEDVKNYPYYEYMCDSAYSDSDNFLFDGSVKESYNLWMSPCAYSISSRLGGTNFNGAVYGGAGNVIFANDIPASLTKGIGAYAFSGDTTGFAINNGNFQPMTDPSLASKVITNGLNEKMVYVSVKIEYDYISYEMDENWDTVEVEKVGVAVLTINFEAGSLTEEQFIAKVHAASETAKTQEMNPDTWEMGLLVEKFDAILNEGKTFTYSNNGAEINFGDIKGGSLIVANI